MLINATMMPDFAQLMEIGKVYPAKIWSWESSANCPTVCIIFLYLLYLSLYAVIAVVATDASGGDGKTSGMTALAGAAPSYFSPATISPNLRSDNTNKLRFR